MNTKILTLNIEKSTKAQAYRKIVKFLAENKKCRKIYTPNPQMALGCYRSRELSELFSRADMLLPDGIGLIIASKILGNPLPERITGIDTAEFILKFAEKKSLSVALIGAKENVASLAKDKLTKKFPRLRIIYTHHGYFDKNGEENDAVIRELKEHAPDILFVCFGFPLQERWIDNNSDKIPSLRLCIGLGGALDVWSGNVKRAPQFIQCVNLEWLWRILGDNTRKGSLSDITKFILLVFTQKSKKKH